MKKLMVAFLMVCAMVASVAAEVDPQFFSVDSQITPGVVNMEVNDVVDVEYCAEKVFLDNSRAAYPGLTVTVNAVCQDQNGVFGCHAADIMYPAVFTAVAIDAVTGADGCATVQLTSINALGGTFFYEVNGAEGDAVVTEETGTAYIPEFTTIGAGLVLLGAGLYSYRKRK
jgi:LPXTG-motif cell wall-anchored protein